MASKLELIIELKNKLFNKKLMQTKKNFSRATDKMRSKMNKWKTDHIKAFNEISSQFPSLSRGLDLLKNKYVLMGAAIVGLVLFLGKATTVAAEFNHEFLQIQNLNLDKSKQQLEDYKNTIRDTAFTIGTDLNETTKAFYDVQSATGFFGDEARQVVEEVGKFSIATGADLNESINATTKSLKAFNLGVSDTKMLLESNAKTVQVGITTFQELAKVQTEYAGAAAGAGQTVNTANKIFAAFTSIAKDSQTAATMTKTAFQGLTQKQTIKGLKKIGIEMYDQQGNMRDLSKILGEVNEKFKKMSPKAIDELINNIGGPEGLRNLFVKLKVGAEDFFSTMDAFDSSSFDLDKALENAKGDFKTLSDIVRNRWGVVMESVGRKILPIVAKALNAINDAIVFARNNWNWLGPLVYGLAAAFTVWKVSIFAASGGFKTLFKAIGSGIKSVPIIGWIVAIASAIYTLIQTTEGWGKSWEGTKKLGKLALDQIGLYLNHFWERLKINLKIMKLQFANLFQYIGEQFKRVGQAFKMALSGNFEEAAKLLAKDIKTAASIEIDALRKQREQLDKEHRRAALRNTLDALEASKEISIKWKSSGVPGMDDLDFMDTAAMMEGDLGDGESGDQISKVVGAGTQVRNINIAIDSFVKGGINTQNTVMSKMTGEEIERYMNEMFLRIVRNAELTI